jgi:hypothetical protein
VTGRNENLAETTGTASRLRRGTAGGKRSGAGLIWSGTDPASSQVHSRFGCIPESFKKNLRVKIIVRIRASKGCQGIY